MQQFILVLLVFMWGSGPSKAAEPQLDNRHYRQCRVTSPFVSSHISAYMTQDVSVTGCVSNQTTRGSKPAEVHAISYHSNWHGDNRKRVDLMIQTKNSNADDQTPVILVLTSSSLVRWHVKMAARKGNHQHILIIMSKGSRIRFSNKNEDMHPCVEKNGSIPNVATELLSWLENKFGAATSISELSEASSITLSVGLDSTAGGSCNLSKNSSPLPTVAMVKHDRRIEGCLVESRRNYASKLVYIVELRRVHQSKLYEVNLDITGVSRHAKEKEFCLVLISPNNVRWKVHSRKVEGRISIVANNDKYVDMTGIQTTSSVRPEKLPESGEALLSWVEYYIGAVFMYASMNNTNHIKITLPKGVETSHDMDSIHSTPDPFLDSNHTKTTLKRAMRTDCSQGHLVVAIEKIVIQMLGLKEGQITLADQFCRATENDTHIFAMSTGQGCGTRMIDNGEHMTMFLNSLVVHSNSVVRDDSIEETGSGDGDIYSGSGDNDLSDVYIDDEDMRDVKIQVDFTCNVDTAVSAKLELFESIMYDRPISNYPFHMQHEHSRLYMQAMMLDTPYLRAVMDSCWLTPQDTGPEMNKYSLIENKCAVDDTVQLQRTLNQPVVGAKPQSQRYSFTLENYAKLETSPFTFLKCHLTYCCIGINCGPHNYPLCDRTGDGCVRRRHGHSHSSRTSQLIVVGPIHLPQELSTYAVESSEEADVHPEIHDEEGTGKLHSGGNPKEARVVIEGLDSLTVVGIAFGAFIIGVLMMGALWYIHSHPGACSCSVNVPRHILRRFRKNRSTENVNDYGESTPGSSAPIST